ncbi:hypothetical protein V8J88_05935 [Massilia sp. W12]|uniref:outer membrane lipoprotein n=1 Tax=Massilia sp. W12 TaxID=3126507 RepID=UPI0030CB1569
MSHTFFTRVLPLALAAAFGFTGCAIQNNSANVYKARETQIEMTVRFATVEALREVQIEQGRTGVGASTGAILGGIAAGSNIGGGNGATAAGVAGAVLGGIIGQQVENSGQLKKGYEITVRLENGELRAVIQDADETFKVGDKVRLVSHGQKTRVTR